MAVTNIKAAQSLAAQAIVYSSEIENVDYGEIAAYFSAGATGARRFTLQRKTTNSDWRTACDAYGVPFQFDSNGEESAGIVFSGMVARYLRVKCEIFGGGSGTMNLEFEQIAL